MGFGPGFKISTYLFALLRLYVIFQRGMLENITHEHVYLNTGIVNNRHEGVFLCENRWRLCLKLTFKLVTQGGVTLLNYWKLHYSH